MTGKRERRKAAEQRDTPLMPRDVLRRAKQIYRIALIGLEDSSSPILARKWAGVCNVLVWGRAVTNILQNLKNIVGEAEWLAWYEPRQKEMRDDPMLKWCATTRSDLLKNLSVEVVFTHNMPIDDYFWDLIDQRPDDALGPIVGFNEADEPGWWVGGDGGRVFHRATIKSKDRKRISSDVEFKSYPSTHFGF